MQRRLDQILSEEYGVGVIYADPTTIIWAVDQIEDIEFAKKELDRINKYREKWGRRQAYVPYGHRLF